MIFATLGRVNQAGGMTPVRFPILNRTSNGDAAAPQQPFDAFPLVKVTVYTENKKAILIGSLLKEARRREISGKAMQVAVPTSGTGLDKSISQEEGCIHLCLRPLYC